MQTRRRAEIQVLMLGLGWLFVARDESHARDSSTVHGKVVSYGRRILEGARKSGPRKRMASGCVLHSEAGLTKAQ